MAVQKQVRSADRQNRRKPLITTQPLAKEVITVKVLQFVPAVMRSNENRNCVVKKSALFYVVGIYANLRLICSSDYGHRKISQKSAIFLQNSFSVLFRVPTNMVFVMSQLAKQCGRHIGSAHGESANRMPN